MPYSPPRQTRSNFAREIAFIVGAFLLIAGGVTFWVNARQNGSGTCQSGANLSGYAREVLLAGGVVTQPDELLAYVDNSEHLDGSSAAILEPTRLIFLDEGRYNVVPIDTITRVKREFDALGLRLHLWAKPGDFGIEEVEYTILGFNAGEEFFEALQDQVAAAEQDGRVAAASR